MNFIQSGGPREGVVGNNGIKCRLLYLIGQLHTGGSERQLCYLFKAMERERYKPAVAVWTHREEDVYVPQIRALGVPLYSFSSKLSSAAKLIAFRRLVRQLQPEVVHSYSFYTNFAAYWAAQGTAVIPVGSIRSDLLWARKECGPILGKLSARWPSSQICNSFSAADTARSLRSLFTPARLSVVRNGIDLKEFRRFAMPYDEPVRIVGIGYLLPVKRWEWLLAAVQELRKKNFNCLVEIAGDGPLRSALERRAEELGVTDRVQFLGHVDDVPSLLARASFIVHTADIEGCPNAVMEAMACGRAVVATDAGDIPSLVEDGRTGFVVRRGDKRTLVDCMVKLITDRALCRRMGAAGRAKADREFGLDRLVQETLAAYRAAGWKDAPNV